MNNNSQTVVRIGVSIIAMVLMTLRPAIDLEFIEPKYRGYVLEYINTLEENGIRVPAKIRWTVKEEPSFWMTRVLGRAEGMDDDRQVDVLLTPLMYRMTENEKKFIIWHELTHDIFNVRHGETILMKPQSGNDDMMFPIARVALIKYLKSKQ